MFEMRYNCNQLSCIFVFRTDKYCIVEASEDWVQPMKHCVIANNFIMYLIIKE